MPRLIFTVEQVYTTISDHSSISDLTTFTASEKSCLECVYCGYNIGLLTALQLLSSDIGDFMNSSKLEPPIWKGQNFAQGGIFGTRVLIVGESTYTTDGKDTFQYNIAMAEDHIEGYKDAFRTKLVRSFLNKNTVERQEIKEFWNSVCYFNYINIPLGGPRIAPEESVWAENTQPLASILTELKPNILVALGYRMWDKWLSSPQWKLFPGPKIDGAGRNLTYYFEASDSKHRTLSYALKHPSSSFSWKLEHPFLMKAIEASRSLNTL